MKSFYYLPILVSIFFLSSCSLFSNRGLVSGDQTVSKEQYDELLTKYQELLKERRASNEVVETTTPATTEDAGVTPDELAKKIGQAELAETVDIFHPEKKAVTTETAQTQESTPYQNNLANELLTLKKATIAMENNEFKKSLGFINELEGTRSIQVKVRAKFLVGELLYRQQEFDLAMQAFEEIINNHAFSGVVIKTLGRLVVCSEKLKLVKKRDHYFSLLHDVFQGEQP